MPTFLPVETENGHMTINLDYVVRFEPSGSDRVIVWLSTEYEVMNLNPAGTDYASQRYPDSIIVRLPYDDFILLVAAATARKEN